MAKKERDIVKLLYEENKEYSKVMTFVKKHMKTNNPCVMPASKKIAIEYDLPLASFGNSFCAYIEFLQNEINKLKDK